MPEYGAHNYYETLQLSDKAELDTIHRVYRLLALRFHPDNQETGNADRFRLIHEAYSVLGDPEQRARYDIAHQEHRQNRPRLASSGTGSAHDFEIERMLRFAVLQALYTQRRLEPARPSVFVLDLEDLLDTPREHLEFTIWYLVQKKLVQRGDNSQLLITAEGADYLEENHLASAQVRRLSLSSLLAA